MAIGDNALTVPKVVMTLSVPGPAEGLLRARCQLELLGEILPPDRYRAAIGGADALLPQLRDRIDEAALEAAGPNLKVVSNYAVGLDNIDIPACTARGIYVGHTPEVLTDATADLAVTLLLAAARRVVEADREMREGRYLGWLPDYLLGQEVTGATLGVIGFGRIGQAVARRAAQGFAMRILAYDPAGVTLRAGLLVEECSLERLLRESDFVSCHVPLTEATHHLIGKAELAIMRRSAILVNTSRGPIIDEGALVEALQSGEIAGAGLDVYENEPRMTPGLAACTSAVLLPHLGSATGKTRAAMGELAARNILAVLDGGPPIACANPEASSRR
ncbi:MAG TPA: D-glycerate dehydrogenase [Candidatus Dormibacteraeota bacterium]|nr:D-glycerate dehydrogenase [Candidatus Dormibacteraeota bacterium]